MKTLVFKNFPQVSYPVNEAFNALSTNVTFSGQGVKKLMITSAHASEGKSFTSMNLARKLAERGKKVVLVDADLRRSMIESVYGIQFDKDSQRFGLSHYLAGIAGLDDTLYRTGIEGLLIVPMGRELPNPIPLLASERFSDMLDVLAREADYVIVDAPPVGVVVDAAEIAKHCDGILLVVSYNEVHRQELIDAKAQLEQSGCPILGAVLNQVDYGSYANKKYYYKSHYSSYYKSYSKSAETKETSSKEAETTKH